MTLDISKTTTLVLSGTALAALATYFYQKKICRNRRKKEPPIVDGHFIWGSAKDFNEHAVQFLHNSEKKYGKVFTIRLINQYLTIITDPRCYEAVHREKNFDFDPIQEQVNRNVFNFNVFHASQVIRDMSRATRGQWLIKDVSNFSEKLNSAFERFGQENIGLRQFCAETIFDAIFNTVFGQSDRNAPFNPLRTYKNFEYYHKYFNYMWLGLPKKLMPGIMDTLCDMCQQPSAEELLSREDCSEYIKRGIRHLLSNGQTDADVIGHNLVMLHVNYNTFRMAFWVLYYILRDPEAWRNLSEEINELSDKTSLSTSDVDRLRVLDSVVQESARLSSGVFMVRYVQKDTMFKTPDGEEFLIRAGDRLAMYPPAIHKDPEIFEDPLTFKFDRFINSVFYKDGHIVKNPVMPFGTICPGKRLALLQLKLFIINIVSNFDVKLNDGETTELDNKYHGHEVLPPTNDVQISIKRKNENFSSFGCFS